MQWYWFSAIVCATDPVSADPVSQGRRRYASRALSHAHSSPSLHATAPNPSQSKGTRHRRGCDDHIQTHTCIVSPLHHLPCNHVQTNPHPTHVKVGHQLYNVLHQGSKTSLHCMQRRTESASEQLLPNTECTTKATKGKKYRSTIPLASHIHP